MIRTCNNTFPSKGFKGDGKAGFWSPKGVAESPEGDSLYAYPAGRLMTWFHLAYRRRGVTGG